MLDLLVKEGLVAFDPLATNPYPTIRAVLNFDAFAIGSANGAIHF